MNLAFYLILFWLLVFWITRQIKKKRIAQYLNRIRRKEHETMTEAAKQFIDKECCIYMLSGELNGIIREVTNHAMLVETPCDRQLINLDFVVRILEYPEKKKGRKK